MFIHNLNPILVSVGFIQIRWYSLAYIAGFLLVYFVLLQAAKKNLISGLTKESVEDFIVYVIIGVIIGGRLGRHSLPPKLRDWGRRDSPGQSAARWGSRRRPEDRGVRPN